MTAPRSRGVAPPASETGWQPDGSYVPCADCGWEPPKRPPHRPEPPGFAVHLPGTVHYADCPSVPRLSPQDEKALRERLIEMDRVRRRGAAEARNVVIW